MSLSENLKSPVDYNFTPALERPYVPREGFYPGAKYQLSVAPHPKMFIPTSEMIGKSNIETLWREVLLERANNYLSGTRGDLISVGKILIGTDFKVLKSLAFGSTTEQLFKKFIVPAIKEHCQKTKKSQVAIDDVSYLLPLWNKKELEPTQIVEGELSRLIKEGGKLPKTVGAVFLDYPPNQQKKDVQYSFQELVKFIKKNPNIFFVVDQANLHFENLSVNITKDLIFLKTELRNSLVLVTDTTTKAFGLSGCAVVFGTDKANKLLKQKSEAPVILFDNQEEIDNAKKTLYLETSKAFNFDSERYLKFDAVNAISFRTNNFDYKEKLKNYLRDLFGESVVCPELVVEGARIIINAQKIGFKNAQELSDKLASKNFKIATKPATVYVSPKKYKEWETYVHMTVPWKDEIMTAVRAAFKTIHDQKHSTPIRFKV